MMKRKVTKAKICGRKTAARGINAVRGFVIAILCVCACAAGCASKNDTKNAPASATETPISDNDGDSENTGGAGERENGGEENGAGDNTSGEDSGDTKGDSAGGTSDTGDDSDTTGGDETREEKRFAEYYADGKLIRKCKITEIGNEILDEPAVPPRPTYNGDNGYDGEWIETPSDKADTVRFEARYTPKVFTIEYDLNRGVILDGKTNPETYTVETETFEFFVPIRKNYEFRGWWYTDEAGEHEITGIECGTIARDLRVYAKWEKIN